MDFTLEAWNFMTFLIFIWCDFSESVHLEIMDYSRLMDFNGF